MSLTDSECAEASTKRCRSDKRRRAYDRQQENKFDRGGRSVRLIPMKKLKLIAAMAILLGATAPAFSIAQIGVQGNYISLTFDSSLLRVPTRINTQVLGVGAFARFTVGIPLLITFGFGAHIIDYGTIKGGPSTAGPASTQTGTRRG
jgi:hypothetical protein